MTLPALAKQAWYVQIQCEITSVIPVGPVPGGFQIDVAFEGVAGGPNVKDGTVEGLDHLVIDALGVAHLHVYYTITDKDGDQLSVYVWGDSYQKGGRIIFQDTFAVVIDETGYPTTGKYDGSEGTVFRDEGFVTDFSDNPPGGYIHAKLYYMP
jgi:hypothetical protein